MRRLSICLALALMGAGCTQSPENQPAGSWNAWLESPGGRLDFDLVVRADGTGYRGEISGGEEVLHPPTHFENGELLLEFPHFDATIRARFNAEEQRLDGEWSKVSGHGERSGLPFHAVRKGVVTSPQEQIEHDQDTTVRALAQMEGNLPTVGGRWAVDFESSEDLAVGLFEQIDEGPRVRGSFLTTTGDYRYLWGEINASGELQLQAFDGAHAFLFRAYLHEDGELSGDFWSRDSWHERWTAVRDDEIELPDAFALTRLEESVPLASLRYPDLDGELRSLDDPAFAGQARIIEVFGTWCPNCYDATQYLKDLNARYGERGLSILGLAFELSGDLTRDTAQVRRYIESLGIEYPVLIAGTSDKIEASKAFPLVDRVRSYPTFLFVDANDQVRAIYTGFSGPATGAAHESLKRGFEEVIEDLLSEEARPAR